MNSKRVIVAFLVTLLCATVVSAENASTSAWLAPCNLGSGSEPVFSLDFRNQLSVAFENEEQVLQSSFQADGAWARPGNIASGLPENTIQAFDHDGNRWVAQEQDEEITISRYGADGENSQKEVVVEKLKSGYLTILHFSIDAMGRSHLLYGRTPEYDYEVNNPGMNVFYRRSSGTAWEKELLVASKMSFSRIWQKPGIVVGADGRVFVCSYKDLYSFDEKNEVQKETCPIADFSMPFAVAVEGKDTLHFVFHAYDEKAGTVDDNLYYVMRQGGKWCGRCTIGKQPAETSPAIILTPANELHVAWQDADGNILVSRRKIE